MMRNGIATNVSASTTAVGENGIVMPNQSSSRRPTIPLRPNASSSATPPTTGGRTSGSVTSARTTCSPGTEVLASSHASGTPMTRAIPVATVAVHSDSHSA